MTQEEPEILEPESAEEPIQVESSGETVGEAKWTALRELERQIPNLNKAEVEYQVLSEGERGLLGVGQVPARVIAIGHPGKKSARPLAAREKDDESSASTQMREYLELVCGALGCPARIEIEETDEELTASLYGSDLGLVIGKRGQTIDAIQYLANAVLWRGETERKNAVVDAAGYRGRRQTSLERTADRAASDALAGNTPVALEPMSAVERKIIHTRLSDRTDVETASDGREPNRHVVVRPASKEIVAD